MIRISGAYGNEARTIKKTEKAVYNALDQRDIFSADLTIADEDDIKRLNAAVRGIDSVTDVLSFPNLENIALPCVRGDFPSYESEGRRVILGSIMICRKRAEQQAEEYGQSYLRELSFLTCHGLLHLLGFDHEAPTDEKIMIEKQKEIMKNLFG